MTRNKIGIKMYLLLLYSSLATPAPMTSTRSEPSTRLRRGVSEKTEGVAGYLSYAYLYARSREPNQPMSLRALVFDLTASRESRGPCSNDGPRKIES